MPEQIIFIDNSSNNFLRKYIYQFEFVEYVTENPIQDMVLRHIIVIAKSIKRTISTIYLNADVYFKSDVINEMIDFMKKI